MNKEINTLRFDTEQQKKINYATSEVVEACERENLTYEEAMEVLRISEIMIGKRARLKYVRTYEDSNGIHVVDENTVACTKEEWKQTEAIRYLATVIQSGKKCGKVPALLIDLL